MSTSAALPSAYMPKTFDTSIKSQFLIFQVLKENWRELRLKFVRKHKIEFTLPNCARGFEIAEKFLFWDILTIFEIFILNRGVTQHRHNFNIKLFNTKKISDSWVYSTNHSFFTLQVHVKNTIYWLRGGRASQTQ